jgi:S-methylmethionine-dependent homocysteine/selenocysteine methylase
MSKYRDRLPQLADRPFLTDGGLETTLIYHEGVDLPHFAAFVLLKDGAGTAILRRYLARHAGLARAKGAGVVLESPTWRANPEWAAKLGYDAASRADANRRGIDLLLEIRDVPESRGAPIDASGNLDPRGDGYRPDARMSVNEARAYHAPQVETSAWTGADRVAAFTMNYTEEATGIVTAAKDAGMPFAISVALETDGRRPSGDALSAAIERTYAETGGYAACYMINCAHRAHFESALRDGGRALRPGRSQRAASSTRGFTTLVGAPFA